jgi:hypothetical protein
VVLLQGCKVSVVGEIRILETTEEYFVTVDCDFCVKRGSSWAFFSVNPFWKSGFFVPPCPGIRFILRRSGRPQVTRSIVKRVSIPVVYFIGQPALDVEEYETRPAVEALIDAEVYTPICGIDASCFIPWLAFVIVDGLFPPHDAGCLV